MATSGDDKKYAKIQRLISTFCLIILIQDDSLNELDAKKFIDKLSKDDITSLNVKNAKNDPRIKGFVLDEVVKYINNYPTDGISKPFDFDSAGSLEDFHLYCARYYESKNANSPLPEVLDATLTHIHDVSDHYRVFGHFYNFNSKLTMDKIVTDSKNMAVETARKTVERNVGQLTEKQIRASVQKEANKLPQKVSETSVTILGIFAGIVVTVIAGLMYSSSVLENINSANPYRLLCMCSLIGLVCLHLISMMFSYIAKIGGKNEVKMFSNVRLILISIVLIVLIVVGIVGECLFLP